MPGSRGELFEVILGEGPLTAYPRMKNETVNVDNVVESLSNSAFIKDVAGAKIDDAKGLSNLSTTAIPFRILGFLPDKAEPTDQ